MNNLLFSLAMAALGQFTGLGGGGFGGGGLGSPGLGFGSGFGGPRFGGGYPGAMGPGNGIPGVAIPGIRFPGNSFPGNRGPDGMTVAPVPYGSGPMGSGYASGTTGLQLASLTAARCLEQAGQLAPGEGASLLLHQGRARGWPDGWQQRFPDHQSEQLLAHYGGCDGLLSALRQGRLDEDRLGRGQLGQGPGGGGLISQKPYAGEPSQSQAQPNSEAEAFGLAPYR